MPEFNAIEVKNLTKKFGDFVVWTALASKSRAAKFSVC
jgi:hypothetical protein